ncbi:hypothetical protein [Bacillus massilinigeriensis]|uniref:hypothetical protein n=1 Tax=Bacillus massilionigeriensis TaxID=1805475 RepID=UPI00096B3B53|nr:hypothetical protein [Bacillus massilionigeriensis]
MSGKDLFKGLIGVGLGIGSKLLLDSNDQNDSSGGYYGSYTTEEIHNKLEDYLNELSELTAQINYLNAEIKSANEELRQRNEELENRG